MIEHIEHYIFHSQGLQCNTECKAINREYLILEVDRASKISPLGLLLERESPLKDPHQQNPKITDPKTILGSPSKHVPKAIKIGPPYLELWAVDTFVAHLQTMGPELDTWIGLVGARCEVWNGCIDPIPPRMYTVYTIIQHFWERMWLSLFHRRWHRITLFMLYVLMLKQHKSGTAKKSIKVFQIQLHFI